MRFRAMKLSYMACLASLMLRIQTYKNAKESKMIIQNFSAVFTTFRTKAYGTNWI